VVDIQTASDRPGDGQRQVVTQLQNAGKLRLPTDKPDSPVYVRDRTPLKKGQITTAALRTEFRQDPSLPMLVGDEVFIKGIRLGIEQDDYVYQSGDLLRGKGDPHAEIKVDEQSFIYTTSYAQEHGIWPRQEPKSETSKTDSGARSTDDQADQRPEITLRPATERCPRRSPPLYLRQRTFSRQRSPVFWNKRGSMASAAWRR
jgi:hypothetical protein